MSPLCSNRSLMLCVLAHCPLSSSFLLLHLDSATLAPLLALKHCRVPVLLHRLFALSELLLFQIPIMPNSVPPEILLKSHLLIQVNNYHPSLKSIRLTLPMYCQSSLTWWLLSSPSKFVICVFVCLWHIFCFSLLKWNFTRVKKSVFCLFMALHSEQSMVKGNKICHTKICLFTILIILGWLFLRNGRLRRFFFLPPSHLTSKKNLR